MKYDESLKEGVKLIGRTLNKMMDKLFEETDRKKHLEILLN